MSTYILQPPLPEGEPAEIVVGTDNFLLSHPVLRSGKAQIAWFDMRQPKGKDEHERVRDTRFESTRNENWWPGLRRWHLGLYCPNATLELGEPQVLESDPNG